MNWLERDEKIARNPLRSVEKVRDHTPKLVRRALTLEDARKFIEVSGPRGVVYLVCLYTGLRREELRQLEWRDVHLETEIPFLALRAATTKNRKAATLHLHPDAANALRKLRPAGVSATAKIFPRMVPRIPRFRQDLKAAGIPFEDEAGRRLDLHALRKSFQMLLTLNGTQPRVAMALMRHSDIKLTMGAYTDAGMLPTAEAISSLPSLATPAKGWTPQLTPKTSFSPVSEGPALSPPVAPFGTIDGLQSLMNTSSGRDEAPPVAASHNRGKWCALQGSNL